MFDKIKKVCNDHPEEAAFCGFILFETVLVTVAVIAMSKGSKSTLPAELTTNFFTAPNGVEHLVVNGRVYDKVIR
jgi:hypothetical protein